MKVTTNQRKAPYNLLGGPAGAIAFLIKSLKDEVQTCLTTSYISLKSVSINELEKSEESFQEKKKSESSCNLISASKEILVGAYSSETEYLQNTEVTEKTCSNELHPCPISTSNVLPETASQLLRYYGKIYNLLLLTHYGRHLESFIQRMA
ncbi:unnamed protein product [Rhizophagus irregularis]|uniref:Uncharacterized protein n=1 Tax=Rhizophagus irregularis TaxID=588596 RepID=A0A916ECF9_9GLOM|nr:unnamed protein product [Rhizophagus irregularis]CAB5371604.1 unnamed protein product [Rhizophagus irregularis]